MINEKELKARMAGALELIKMQIPEFCEENGASKKDFTVATVSAFKTIEGIVDKLAAKGCWIPCSERLPEDESIMYWTTHEDGSVVMHGFTKKNGFIFNWEVDDLEKRKRQGDVIAWMPLPLPKPYKERNEE